MSKYFITGGTGFLGAQLITEILLRTDHRVYSLVRGASQEQAEKYQYDRLKEVFPEDICDIRDIKPRVKVCLGDTTKDNLGLSSQDYELLINEVDSIYNSAAITDFNRPLETVRKVNLYGTKNVLDFALICKKKKGPLKTVNHISTAYVVGRKKCIFKEKDLDVGQTFNNTYEQSKYETEKEIGKYREKGLNINIFRPTTILGRFSDGKTTNFKMFYQPLHFFAGRIC